MSDNIDPRSVDSAYASFYPQYYLQKIDRQVIRCRIRDAVIEHGYYPPIAAVSIGDPPVYIGAQIRLLTTGEYIVANVQWKQYGAPDLPSKTFADLDEAVDAFIMGTVGGRPLYPFDVD
jgi:hypothetical protein